MPAFSSAFNRKSTNRLWIRLSVLVLGMLVFMARPGAAADGLSYIPNQGQWNQRVAYRAQLTHGRFFLEKHGFTYSFLAPADVRQMHHQKALSGAVEAHAIKVRFKGATTDPELTGTRRTGTAYNFYLGNNPDRWQQALPAYRHVQYRGLYKGIDLDVTSHNSRIKYNFEVSTGKDPDAIKLAYKGADSLYLDEKGNLVVQTSVNEYREMAPKAYQVINGERKAVPCHYQLDGSQLSFAFPEGYDDKHPLTIDPEVIFSTFSGSKANNFGYSAAFDTAGHGYSAGTVFGSDFPTTPGAYQVAWGDGSAGNWGGVGGARDIGILKYNDSGTAVDYVTFLGGSGNEDPHSMIVDSDQDLLVFGNTESGDFPVTPGAYDTSYNGNYDIYVSKLSADGSQLKASTYIGGNNLDGLNGRQQRNSNQSDLGWNYGDMFRGEVIVDEQDRVLVATTTKSGRTFPVTSSSFQPKYGGGNQDGCIFRLSPDLQKLEAASFVGGGADDAAYSLTMAPDQSILLTGGTKSNNLNFPLSGYQQQNKGGAADAMVLRIPPDFETVSAATLLGTNSYDQSYFVQTNQLGEVYLAGQTTSDQFPTRQAVYSVDSGKQFISKFDSQLNNLLLSATFGSGNRPNPDLSLSAFLVDTCGKIYLSGWGGETNFEGNTNGLPITKGAFDTTTDGSDFYLAVFSRNMNTLLYGTYYGGGISDEHVDGGTSRFDKNGTIYQSICAGCGGNSDLPTTKNAYSRTNNGTTPGGFGGCNNALLKIDLEVRDVPFAGFSAPSSACRLDSIPFKDQSRFADSFVWFFGDGDTAYSASPVHQYDTGGTYTVEQIVITPASCNYADTAKQQVTVYEAADPAIAVDTGSCTGARTFRYTGKNGNRFQWQFGDSSAPESGTKVQHSYDDTGTYIVSCLVDSGTVCADTATDTVRIREVVRADFTAELDSCTGKATFIDSSANARQSTWILEGEENAEFQRDTIQYQYRGTDTFYPALVAEPDRICADTATDTLRFTPQRPRFSYAVTDTCDLEVQFTNESSFGDSVQWRLPDTTIEGRDTVLQSFARSGTFDVAMWRKGANQYCQDTARQTVTLKPQPAIDAEITHPACEPYLLASIDSGQVSRIRWQLSAPGLPYDSSFSTLQDGDQIPVPAPNTSYRVQAVGAPGESCPDTVMRQLTVDSFTKARFSIALDTCQQQIRLNSQSSAGDQYKWEFGDSEKSQKTEPSHKYAEAGNYPVTLFTLSGGCRDTATQLIEVPPLPRAGFSVDTESCSPRVAFESTGTIDYPHLWDFGNGDTTVAKSPSKRYRRSDSFEVQLVVGPEARCTDTQKQQVQVPAYVEADVSVNSKPCQPLLSLEASAERADSVSWRGPLAAYIQQEGQPSIRVKPDSAGLYTVSLIAFNEVCTDTVTQTVRANPRITSDFSFEAIPCQPKVRFRASIPEGSRNLWKWGDGLQTEQASDTIHKYWQSGTYAVKHIADPYGPCSDTTIKRVTISQKASKELEAPNVFSPNGDGVNDKFTIQGLKDCEEYTLYVYNRWGTKVYEASGTDLAWDGRAQGSNNRLRSGTYFYKLEGPKGFHQEGTVEIMR